MHCFIITAAFPFPPGEQFLETEIGYWAQQHQARVTILPLRAAGERRPLPPGIEVDVRLARKSTPLSKVGGAVRTSVSGIFWREIGWQLANGRLSLLNVKAAHAECRRVFLARRRLCACIDATHRPITVYSYWFNHAAYAAALLRRAGRIDHLHVRAHRHDIYEEASAHHYLPLKRQFASDIDRVWAICDSGAVYLRECYGIAAARTAVARLGVVLRELTEPSGPRTLRVLSVSFCIRVKRLDRIIDALSAARQDPRFEGFAIEWLHLGDGPLRASLETQAKKALGALPNLQYRFLGAVPNEQVLRIMREGNIDVFLNTSESEGVPVSIMEAMSCGIPVIAPAVGGVDELVDADNGTLLGADPSIREIVSALSDIDRYKSAPARHAAQARIADSYSAPANYRAFVGAVLGQSR